MTNQVACLCGRPTSGTWLCKNCVKTLRWSLVNVSAHYGDLGTVSRKQARYGTTGASKGSIGKTQPLPVDMRFTGTKEAGSQLKYDAWFTVVAWTRTVMAQRPEFQLTNGPAHPWACDHATCLTARGACTSICLHTVCAQIRVRRWPSGSVASMIHYLARQFDWITRQQWVHAFMSEFLDLEHRLTRMVNRPVDRWYAGRCGAGDQYATCETELYASAERGHIDCPGCGIRHDVSERRAILLNEAKEYLVTATEAAKALMAWTDYDGTEKKLVDRIAKWRDREKLDVADVTSLLGRDRHLYRLGDVQDLLVGDAQDAQAKSLAAS